MKFISPLFVPINIYIRFVFSKILFKHFNIFTKNAYLTSLYVTFKTYKLTLVGGWSSCKSPLRLKVCGCPKLFLWNVSNSFSKLLLAPSLSKNINKLLNINRYRFCLIPIYWNIRHNWLNGVSSYQEHFLEGIAQLRYYEKSKKIQISFKLKKHHFLQGNVPWRQQLGPWISFYFYLPVCEYLRKSDFPWSLEIWFVSFINGFAAPHEAEESTNPLIPAILLLFEINFVFQIKLRQFLVKV